MDKLVSTDWLDARLGADDLVVIDATMHLPDSGRDACAEFEASHIRGARFLDLANFIDESSAVPKAMPTAAQYAEKMAELGIAPGSRIVLYDDSAIRSAARAWLIFDSYGEEKLAILDGGLAKWREEGKYLSSRVFDHSPRPRSPAEGKRNIVSQEGVRETLGGGHVQIVDARDAARFEGREGSGSEGHIPGAKNLPFGNLFAENGTYKSPEQIRAEFESAGVDLEKPIITSCNSGMTASVLVFGLELAGARGAALYDGSWMEWSSDTAAPKEKGEAR